MPIIEHSTVRMPAPVDCHAERTFVSAEQGAASLTVKEVELHPGWEGRLHTHSTDEAIMVLAGAVQLIIGGRTEYGAGRLHLVCARRGSPTSWSTSCGYPSACWLYPQPRTRKPITWSNPANIVGSVVN